MQKLFNIFLAFLLTIVGTSAFANTNSYSGFYAGGSIGAGIMLGKGREFTSTLFSFPVSVPPTSIGLSQDRHFSIKSNKFEGVLFGGYGIDCGWLYLGAELFINGNRGKNQVGEFATSPQIFPPAINTASTTTVTVVKVKPFGFGIDLRPGVLLTDETLLFARIGVVRKKINVTSQVDATNFNSNPTFSETLPISLSVNRHKHSSVFRVGGGIEQFICDSLSLRMDYVYSHYGKVRSENSTSAAVNSTTFGVLGTATLSSVTRLKLYNHSVLLGLSYYW